VGEDIREGEHLHVPIGEEGELVEDKVNQTRGSGGKKV
jgi:hypothetical protein